MKIKQDFVRIEKRLFWSCFLRFIFFFLLFFNTHEYLSQVSPAVMKAAKNGNAEAQYQVGFSLCGCVVRECPTAEAKERVYWLTQSSTQGHAGAQTLLAMMYYEGCGVEVNLKKAFDLELKSAQGGNCSGMNNVAVQYIMGEGTEPDLDKAVFWIKKMRDMDCYRWDD
ncbi:MAG: hypothetical protein GC193_14125 [Cryomorphaceae bacterium]|nr:hypothetical protein [Cryomorphaceae bacterium]